jgi:hypothetical protein
MSQRIVTLVGLTLALGFAGATMAQESSASASAVPATADIVAAIAIEKTANLSFGQVVASAALGTVTMATTGNRSSAGGATLASSSGANAAAFIVTGNGTDTFAITLPTSTVTLTHSNATDTMDVDTFTSNPDGTGQLSRGPLPILVGATLHVAAAQVAGHYAGTFAVTVAYN